MKAANKVHSSRDRYKANRLYLLRSFRKLGELGIIADGFVSSVDIAPRGNVN